MQSVRPKDRAPTSSLSAPAPTLTETYALTNGCVRPSSHPCLAHAALQVLHDLRDNFGGNAELMAWLDARTAH
jgi:hypothetical protein